MKGFNDLETSHPLIASEWDYDSNWGKTPSDVIAGTGRRYWWLCALGHKYLMAGDARIRGGSCPYCSNRRLLSGFNDLQTLNPELATEWDLELNGDLTPSAVHAQSHKIVYWRCGLNHSWRRAIDQRANRGCPYCANQRVLVGFNDLQSKNPELALSWHKERNGKLGPADVLPGSNKKVWWLCGEGHEWYAAIGPRSAGVGCPTCAKGGFDPNAPSTLYFLEHRLLAARKIGITNTFAKLDRLMQFKKDGWIVQFKISRRDGHLIAEAERRMLNWIRNDLGLAQQLVREQMKSTRGETETFSEDGPTNFDIVEKIRVTIFNLEKGRSD